MNGRRRGSVLAETALALPLLLFLIFAVVQFALVWTARQTVAYAAYCAARAALVFPCSSENEKEDAARDAAEIALSWMSLADAGSIAGRTSIPGWGDIPGSGTVRARSDVKIVSDPYGGGWLNGEDSPAVAAIVRFKFPLMIPGMGVAKAIANFAAGTAPDFTGEADFHGDLAKVTDAADVSIDGVWPWIELKSTCILPAPFSTARFPIGGMDGVSQQGGL